MLPISAKEPVRFTPDRYRDDARVFPENAPVYLIVVPTLRGKAEFNRACVAAGLVSHDRGEIITALRDGVKAQIADDQAGPLLDMLDRLEAASEAQPADPRDLEDFSILHADMRRHWPRFAAMVADSVHYQQMAPIVAAGVPGRLGERRGSVSPAPRPRRRGCPGRDSGGGRPGDRHPRARAVLTFRGPGKKLRIAVAVAVAVARRPGEFAGGRQAPEGHAWEIAGDRYERNPAGRLGPNDWLMLECWRAWKGGGFGAGYLPDPGGYMDQPSAMIEAFRIMSEAHAALGN